MPLTTLVMALTLSTCLCASISTRARVGSLWTRHARWWGDGALLCALLAGLAYGYGIYEATAIDSDARVVCAAERSSGGVPEGVMSGAGPRPFWRAVTRERCRDVSRAPRTPRSAGCRSSNASEPPPSG